MANSIALAQTYLPLLDEVYKASSRTAILDSTKVEIVNGNTVKVYKTSMDGLGDYSRNNGYTNGDVTGTWETLTLTKDRGRSFQIDRMDNEETIGMAFGTLAGEFIRTKVAPEIDAYTFAKLAGTADILAATPADIEVGITDVAALIDEAEREMNEAEVPTESRIGGVFSAQGVDSKSMVTTVSDYITDVLKRALGEDYEIVMDMAEVLDMTGWDMLSLDAQNNLFESVSSVIGSSETYRIFNQLGYDMSGLIADGIASGAFQVGNEAGNLVVTLKDGTKVAVGKWDSTIVSMFDALGVDIVDGMVTGIDGEMTDQIQALLDIFGIPYEKAAEENEVNSPS